MRLKNKIAMVIGGGSWIGKEIAKTYSKEGATVVIAGPTIKKLENVVKEFLNDKYCIRSALLDVRNENQVINVFNEIKSNYGKIDILVNCAAIYPKSEIDSLDVKEWRDVIDVNLTGSFIVLKYAAEMMKKQSKGKIIFVSSVAGEKLGIPGYAHYGASKAGLNGLMRSAAIELAKYSINVNSINPGNIVNDKRFNLTDEELLKMKQHIPLGRTGKPLDVANLALFLASEESDFITGQDYTIDGGEVIH